MFCLLPTAIVIYGLIAVFVMTMLINADSFLLLLGQDPILSRMADRYIMILCPTVPVSSSIPYTNVSDLYTTNTDVT